MPNDWRLENIRKPLSYQSMELIQDFPLFVIDNRDSLTKYSIRRWETDFQRYIRAPETLAQPVLAMEGAHQKRRIGCGPWAM